MIHTDYEQRCSGESCRQGRLPCATPEACRLSEDDEERAGMQMLVYVFIAAATVALVLVITMWS